MRRNYQFYIYNVSPKKNRNVFLLNSYCTIKFVSTMVPSIVAEIAFSRHLENEFKYDFRYGGINLHRQKDSGNKISGLGHCSFNALIGCS